MVICYCNLRQRALLLGKHFMTPTIMIMMMMIIMIMMMNTHLWFCRKPKLLFNRAMLMKHQHFIWDQENLLSRCRLLQWKMVIYLQNSKKKMYQYVILPKMAIHWLVIIKSCNVLTIPLNSLYIKIFPLISLSYYLRYSLFKHRITF